MQVHDMSVCLKRWHVCQVLYPKLLKESEQYVNYKHLFTPNKKHPLRFSRQRKSVKHIRVDHLNVL